MSKRLIIWLIIILIVVVLYFVIAARFTPSWILGEEVAGPKPAIEIHETDLEAYPNLAKFIRNITRNTLSGEKGVQVLIKGTNGEGDRLKSFLSARFALGNSTYPYVIKYGDKYFGLDIIFQFESPWVLGATKNE